MVQITELLIRKKAEHNESIIGTLEELSLHQEDVDKIENLQNWCKHLEILLLQSNLITKIENLHKLKKLKYLNLAINNIEVIENLEGCESLEKLDLTLNFIGNLESLKSLKGNIHLKDLYLTGNPCVDFAGYREYAVATLPQIQHLDNVEIPYSERIKAKQNLKNAEEKIRKAQVDYQQFRKEQRERLAHKLLTDESMADDEYWHSKSEHAPETRCEMIRRSRKARNKDEVERPEVKEVPVFGKNGKPLNINQAKLAFTIADNPDGFVLDVAVYKYLDTALIDVDLQPWYARLKIKGKVFQYVLQEEIITDKSTCQRSQTTGHLVIVMPKLYVKAKATKPRIVEETEKTTYLEVAPQPDMDFSKIVENHARFMDGIDPDMPPLEFV